MMAGRRRAINKKRRILKKRRLLGQAFAESQKAKWEAAQNGALRQERIEAEWRIKLTARSIELKERATVAEQILYDELVRLGYKFKFQYPVGFAIPDFCFPEKHLIVEVDGGYHNDPLQRLSDQKRDLDLTARGYRIIRFQNREVTMDVGRVIKAIDRELKPRIFQGGQLRAANLKPCPSCGEAIRVLDLHRRSIDGKPHVCRRGKYA